MSVSRLQPVGQRARTVSAATLFSVALVTGGWLLQRGSSGGAAATATDGRRLFDEVRRQITTRYVDSVSQDSLYRKAVDGMLAELHDPYSVFLPPSRVERLNEQTTGNYAGLGLQVDMRDGYVVVVNPLPGGPAERAGILTGDRIVSVGGKSTAGWSPDEVSSVLRGPAGSVVAVSVERPGSVTPIVFRVTRAAIHQSAVRRAALLPGGVGYVDLRVFSDSTATELSSAVDSLVRQGAKSVMLDLRSNPGGLLSQGVEVADVFLDRGQRIVSMQGRTPGTNRAFADSAPQRWPTLPLLVLVDEKTASAAEIVAGALQDHDRAAIVGSTTYGKGSAQYTFPLDSSGALKLTVARWFTPAGRSISRSVPGTENDDLERDTAAPRPRFKTDAGRTTLGGGGITPDVAVDGTTATPQALALQRALGTQVATFRDALTSLALSLKAAASVKSPGFVVTPAMLDDVYARMKTRGVDVPRTVFDEATPLVSRLLAYEIERYVFGADAEFRRKAADDRVILAARKLAAGATTQRQLLAGAAAMVRDSAQPSG